MKRLRQRASAFLMAMIVLAVLTVIGLSLSMVTETEMRLGETEKVINEQFYANEAGSTGNRDFHQVFYSLNSVWRRCGRVRRTRRSSRG